ncbi:hypothetical protein HN784_03315 [bacterium]|jgi:hypothetical protein|nr:hypothetical protein [bacterium]MBT4251324.1 hypothetical protein [bacterium]MBT4598295.1 hypothetical protein [bacterium]MBT6754128.1 hypothetical protein [bacterium]MBT7037948.1 hypothetical protein [bacterium]
MNLFKQLIVNNEDEEAANEEAVKESVAKTHKDSENTVEVKKIKAFDTSPNEDFWFHYGPVVKNLAELRDALLRIDDDLYNYHAKGEENDFARWVGDVFGYKDLASKIEKAKTRKKAYKILDDAVE